MGVAAGRRPTRPSSGSAAAAARAVRTAGPSPRPEPAPRLAAPTHGAARRGRRRPAAGTGAGPPHTRPLQLRDTRSACRHRPGPLGTPLHCAGEYRAQGRRAGLLFPGTPQTRVGLRPGRRRQISSRNLSGSLSRPQFPLMFQVSGVLGAVTEVGNSRARDKCRTRLCLCVWLDAWPRRRLVVNLGSHPKGTQGQADARGPG